MRGNFDASIAAFDVGHVQDRTIIQEIGITTYKAGVCRTVNLVVEGFEAQRAGIPCPYGPTEVVSLNEALARAKAAHDAADLLAFHSGQIDMQLLGFTAGAKPHLDTAYLSGRWYKVGRVPKLGELCARYGIDPVHAHNSGVDSRLTMIVLLAMSTDTSRPHFCLKSKV